MIDEPHRWLEAIANRREYILDQLKGGSPLVAIGYDNGLLLATIGREHQKIFEVYDRIAFSAIGHPADIEKLRLVGIDMAHAEGFARATADVSVRRLVHFGVSPAMKAAFEQIYGAPFIARVLFAELGETAEADILCTIDYDGSFRVRTGAEGRGGALCGVIAGTSQVESAMLDWVGPKLNGRSLTRPEALELALHTWVVGKHTSFEGEGEAARAVLPEDFDARRALREEVRLGLIEAAVLDRSRPEETKFERLGDKDFRDVVK